MGEDRLGRVVDGSVTWLQPVWLIASQDCNLELILKILVTGGAGYIGTHTCLELLRTGHDVHVLDNLYNGSLEALERIERLSNRRLGFSQCDVRDAQALDQAFASFKPQAVIHFAGLKAVAESVAEPERYYDVNVGGTAVLLAAMGRAGCKKIVFSSSATVYGQPQYLPCDENHPLNPINPYGRTKLVGENLLRDWSSVKLGRHAVALRYFNPVGADTSGQIGEDPCEIPNNLMPYISQVAVGRQKCLQVFGNDYETTDGTGVRDYIHVVDLALAHNLAVEKIGALEPFEVINIATGKGISVLEMVLEFEKQSGQAVSYKIGPRRQGDVSAIWANATKAQEKLGFKAKFGVEEMCRDTWRWQSTNTYGYLAK